jgi:hypothetical protein
VARDGRAGLAAFLALSGGTTRGRARRLPWRSLARQHTTWPAAFACGLPLQSRARCAAPIPIARTASPDLPLHPADRRASARGPGPSPLRRRLGSHGHFGCAAPGSHGRVGSAAPGSHGMSTPPPRLSRLCRLRRLGSHGMSAPPPRLSRPCRLRPPLDALSGRGRVACAGAVRGRILRTWLDAGTRCSREAACRGRGPGGAR